MASTTEPPVRAQSPDEGQFAELDYERRPRSGLDVLSTFVYVVTVVLVGWALFDAHMWWVVLGFAAASSVFWVVELARDEEYRWRAYFDVPAAEGHAPA